MRKSSASLLAFILGTTIGAIATLLLAPTRGVDVRSVLSYRVKNYVDRLQDLIKVLARTKAVASTQAKAAGQEVIDETIQKAKQLLKDANDLVAQLD